MRQILCIIEAPLHTGSTVYDIIDFPVDEIFRGFTCDLMSV